MLFFLILTFSSTAQTACYFPSGRLAPNDTPCRDDADNAVCCGQGYACLSNGLCRATGAELQKPGASEYVRGGCTDKSFRSSSCPLMCIDPDVDNVAGGHGLGKCDDTDRDMYYCINSNLDNVNCTSGDGVLFFAGKPSALTTIGVIETTRSALEASSSEIETAASTGSTTTSTTDEAATKTEGSGTESATSSPSLETVSDNSSNKPAIIGGAVGGVVVFCIIVAAVWWFWKKRRSRHSSNDSRRDVAFDSHPFNMGDAGAGGKTGPIYEAPGADGAWTRPLNPVYEVPGSQGTWKTQIHEAPGSY